MYASAVVALIKNVFIDNLQDHSYTSSPRKWKRKLQEAESNLEAARKKIRNCQRREQRAKQNCKFLVDDLYNSPARPRGLHDQHGTTLQIGITIPVICFASISVFGQ